MSYQDILDILNDLDLVRVKLWRVTRNLAKEEEKRLEQQRKKT